MPSDWSAAMRIRKSTRRAMCGAKFLSTDSSLGTSKRSSPGPRWERAAKKSAPRARRQTSITKRCTTSLAYSSRALTRGATGSRSGAATAPSTTASSHPLARRVSW